MYSLQFQRLKTQIKKFTVFLLLGMLFMSCENRWAFKGENIPPELGIKLANGQYTDEEGNLAYLLADTIKLSSKTSDATYTFDMKYFDDNLVEITYEIVKGNGELVQLNVEENESGVIDISQEEVSLEYTPVEMGEHEIKFVAIDAFGEKSASVTIQLLFFDNLAPIAVLSVNYVGETNERHYMFDASASYDQDEEFGGSVVQYKYFVDDKEILTTVNTINYIFQQSGSYSVGLQVLDNDNQWSEVVTETVEVE